MDGAWLSRDDILRLILSIDEAIADEENTIEIVVVGGSALALMGLRDGTRDIDTISTISPALASAIASVAQTNGLQPLFMNSNAAPFTPVLDKLEGEVVFDSGRLRVCAATPAAIFLMKLASARLGVDRSDLVALWPLSGFVDSSDVVRSYASAFPHEPTDPYLDRFVDEIIRKAT